MTQHTRFSPDTWCKRIAPLGFARFLLRRFGEIQVSQTAGSLTFTTLLALVPLLTVMLAVLTAFPMFGDISDAFMAFINETIVPSGASAVSEYLHEFKSQAAKLTSIGIIVMVITSLLLIHTIETTFNRIWRVKHTRPLLLRMSVYWALLTLGPVLVGFSLSASAYFLKNSYLNHYPLLATLLRLGGQLAFSTAALWVLYRVVPNRYVPARHALIGAVTTAVLLETAKWGFGLYISNFNSYQLIYGAFAAIPVFLVWLQLLWTILIGGALLTASLSYWHGQAYLDAHDTRVPFENMVSILTMLHHASQNGQSLSIRDLRQHIHMGYDELGDLLDRLAAHDYIAAERTGWILKTAAEHIRIDTLFRQFVYQPDTQNPSSLSAPLSTAQTLADLSRHTETA